MISHIPFTNYVRIVSLLDRVADESKVFTGLTTFIHLRVKGIELKKYVYTFFEHKSHTREVLTEYPDSEILNLQDNFIAKANANYLHLRKFIGSI